MTWSRIAGTGGYLPERILTNKDMESMVETTDEWIRERSGIHQRHIAADDEMTSDMALAAAKEALQAADVPASEVDLIIVATTTPDRVFPSVACMLQRKLGIGIFADNPQRVSLFAGDRSIVGGRAVVGVVLPTGKQDTPVAQDHRSRVTTEIEGDLIQAAAVQGAGK